MVFYKVYVLMTIWNSRCYNDPLCSSTLLRLSWKRGMAFLEGDNLLVFYYLNTSEICSDKRGTTVTIMFLNTETVPYPLS